MIRHYPVTVLLILAIWVVCLMPIPETRLSHVSFIDKWTHLAMYGTLCLVIWWEHTRMCKSACRRLSSRVWLFVWLLPILMSGLIELVQYYCTGGMRSGEWLDFAANALGGTLAQPIGYCYFRWRTSSSKRQSDASAHRK